jgi:hypothetical protein
VEKGAVVSEPTALEFIERLSDCAEALGEDAGIGGMETAGMVLSFLANRPDWLGAFMKGGITALPSDFFERGLLTFHGADGKVRLPRELRYSRIVAKMKAIPQ